MILVRLARALPSVAASVFSSSKDLLDVYALAVHDRFTRGLV